MPIKTWGTEMLTSSDVNTYLMRQAVIVCTAATRPSSPVEGMHVWQTDTGSEFVYDGSAWRFSKGVPRFVRKTADEAASDTNLQNDNELFVSVEANAKYIVEVLARCSAPTTADIRFGWTFPTGTTFRWALYCPGDAETNKDSSSISVRDFIQTDNAVAAGYGSDAVLLLRSNCVRTSSTPGTLQLQFAQGTTDGGFTSLKAGSYLSARRVA